jgi:GTPase
MIGVEDNGNPLGLGMEETKKSLATIYILAKNLKADLDILDVKQGL